MVPIHIKPRGILKKTMQGILVILMHEFPIFFLCVSLPLQHCYFQIGTVYLFLPNDIQLFEVIDSVWKNHRYRLKFAPWNVNLFSGFQKKKWKINKQSSGMGRRGWNLSKLKRGDAYSKLKWDLVIQSIFTLIMNLYILLTFM